MHHLLENAAEFGFNVKWFSFDLKKVVERSRKVSEKLVGGIGMLMKKNKITVINGEAKLAGAGKISVGKDSYSAKYIIIATGARARQIPGSGSLGVQIHYLFTGRRDPG